MKPPEKPPPRPRLASQKLSQGESPESKLKILWRDALSESERDYWREQFRSTRPQRELRAELHQQYGCELTQDISLTRFRKWVARQDARAEEAEQVHADTVELLAQGLSGEQLRAALLDRMKKRALSGGDFKLGAVAVNLDLKAEAQNLNAKKFALNEAKAEERMKDEHAKALEFCLAAARDFPPVMELFRQAFLALKAAHAGGAPVSDPARLQISDAPGPESGAPNA